MELNKQRKKLVQENNRRFLLMQAKEKVRVKNVKFYLERKRNASQARAKANTVIVDPFWASRR